MKYLFFILGFLFIQISFAQQKTICIFDENGNFQKSHALDSNNNFRVITYSDLVERDINNMIVFAGGDTITGKIYKDIAYSWLYEEYSLFTYSGFLNKSGEVEINHSYSIETKRAYSLIGFLVLFLLIGYFMQRYRYFPGGKKYNNFSDFIGVILLIIAMALTALCLSFFAGGLSVYALIVLNFCKVFWVFSAICFFSRNAEVGKGQRNIFLVWFGIASILVILSGFHLEIVITYSVGLILGLGLAYLVERKRSVKYLKNEKIPHFENKKE